MAPPGATLYRGRPMALDRINLATFRNHRDTALTGTAKFNLLFGDNGAGKTNVLEAISLLAPGRGLRRAALADLPLHGGDGGFAVGADLIAAEAEAVRIGSAGSPERPGRRTVRINAAEAPATSLGEWLSIGWLTPAMDRLFVEGAGARRRFLDRLVLALDPGHARNSARYDAALRERNRLLAVEGEPDPAWFEGIEAQIADAGAKVAAARAATIERLSMALARFPAEPFARPELAYHPDGPLDRDALAAALAVGRRRDRSAQRTLVGPHRDELVVTMAGKGQPASDCSTGEQKAMLIAIILAHAGLLDASRARLLLLDEVAAHLDPVRRTALFERLRAGPAQLWLTGTELAPFADIAAEAAVWRVSGGEVERA